MPIDDPWHKSRARNQHGGHLPPPLSAPDPASPAPPRRPRPQRELRLFGINACLAVFAKRRAAIRKVYLLEALMPRMRAVLAWSASERVGYRLVVADDLRKLTGSEHHEGVCFDTLAAPEHELDAFLPSLSGQSRPWLAWLEGVGNPHSFNVKVVQFRTASAASFAPFSMFGEGWGGVRKQALSSFMLRGAVGRSMKVGAILRSAAHFGCAGVLLSRDAPLALSGAATRVAEGGAESVPILRFDDATAAMALLRQQHYQIITSVVRGGENLFAARLAPRVVLMMGAEGDGVTPAMAARGDLALAIPGSGAVESLNVSAAFAVFAARIAAPE